MAKKPNELNYIKKALIVVYIIALLFCGNHIIVSKASNDETLYLGGFTAGFTITTRGCEVIGLSEVVTEDGIKSPAKDVGIVERDVILSVGNVETNTFEEVDTVLSKHKSGSLLVTVKRGNEVIIKEVTPVKDLSGKFKLGVYLRDKLTGIGTITYVKDNGEFTALGHPICAENDESIELKEGTLYACSVYGIEKGERGKAGELRGMFLSDAVIGVIEKNLAVGIKGKLNDNFSIADLNKIETGVAKQGAASIFTTVNGTMPKEFSISIVKVDKNAKDNRNFVVKITDKRLIEISGGIVQGMSGSPIVQDGKLVGAITHVFLNDPTRGFGISIQNMLSM